MLADDHTLDIVDDPLAQLADRIYGNRLAIFYCHCRLRRAGVYPQIPGSLVRRDGRRAPF